MQASWGAENKAPVPVRSGELYGEKGRWIVDNLESVPDVFTRAEPGVRGADDAKTKFYVKPYEHKGDVQGQSTKKPAEMDLQANGLHNGGFSTPGVMTMVRSCHPPKVVEFHILQVAQATAPLMMFAACLHPWPHLVTPRVAGGPRQGPHLAAAQGS